MVCAAKTDTFVRMFFRTYIVPAAVFQSVIIGGGYGTGREVIEYVTRHGGANGYVACAVIGFTFAVILATAFAFAVQFQARDYRIFLRTLLGRGWFVYEILLTALLVIVIAVVAAAAGRIADQGFGLPPRLGIASLLITVVVLHFFGRQWVLNALSLWSFILMAGLLAFVMTSAQDIALIPGSVIAGGDLFGAARSGFQFAIYNAALVPALLYCTNSIENTRSAALAGAVAGVFGVVPAVLLHGVFAPHMPLITNEEIPVYWLLNQLGHGLAVATYFLILLGTVILTVVGVLQGVQDRLDGWRRERKLAPYAGAVHAGIAAIMLVVALTLSEFGIVTLIARGYGWLSWGFFFVFTLPLLTLGVARIQGWHVDQDPIANT